MDLAVSVELTLQIEPPDACSEVGDIRGESILNGLVFEKTGVTFAPGPLTLHMESAGKLEKTVHVLSNSIHWSTTTSTALSDSTSDTIFVTVDQPRDTGNHTHAVTRKRMRMAMELVSPMASTNPHHVVHELMKKIPGYALKANPAVPSKFNHPKYFNNEGGAWPIADYIEYSAECQAIVRFARKIILQLGFPGEAVMVYVYADPASPKTAKEDPESTAMPALHHHPGYSLVDQEVTEHDVGRRYPPSQTKMPDGTTSMGFNAFEACLKFTAKNGPEGKSGSLETHYYPGGENGSREKSADAVLKHSFQALVQFTSAWYPNDDDPNKLPGLKITKIIAIYDD
ncbi:hypothetical protein B0E48_13435 [Rhodanobacter sp. C03]|nr:hypothetical protein B0E48_13435 [Rhodanobacter sp. C03]